MAVTNQIHSLAIPAANANFTGHTYSEVYAGVDATVTINGQSIVMANGSSIKITVQSISATAGITLLGDYTNTTFNPTVING
jgi:hypothetical protein